MAKNSTAATKKYWNTGRMSRRSRCTELMVRNSSAGVSTKNTRLDKSRTDSGRMSLALPATKPIKMSSTTGKREDMTG